MSDRDHFFAAPAYETPKPLPIPSGSPADRSAFAVGTSPWWIARMTKAMAAREVRLQRLRSYFRGEQDTWKLASEAHRLAFGRAFAGLKSNLAKVVVLAPLQRLKVVGFRVPREPFVAEAQPDEATPLDENDREAWRIWQANGLDSASSIAHTEALVMGECPILVQPNPDDATTPRITVEDPLQVYIERDPVDRRKRRAALKRWVEDDGSTTMILYLPDRIEWWRTRKGEAQTGGNDGWVAPAPGGMAFRLGGSTYEWIPEKSGPTAVPGVVPMVPLVNMPRIDGTGEGEFEAVIPLFDLLNKTLLDMATTSEFAAFPQRWAIGVELEEDTDEKDASGNVIATGPTAYKQAVDRWVTAASPVAGFGQFPAASLEPYTKVIDKILEQIGTITFTPYHYMLSMPTSVPATGEALKSAETSQVAKVENKHIDYGEGWEEVMYLAAQTAGDEARASRRSETLWDEAEARTESQHVDALSKLGSGPIGIPQEALWEMIPASPQQIERWRAMKTAAAAPAPEPPAPPEPIEVTGPDGQVLARVRGG